MRWLRCSLSSAKRGRFRLPTPYSLIPDYLRLIHVGITKLIFIIVKNASSRLSMRVRSPLSTPSISKFCIVCIRHPINFATEEEHTTKIQSRKTVLHCCRNFLGQPSIAKPRFIFRTWSGLWKSLKEDITTKDSNTPGTQNQNGSWSLIE